MGIDIRDFFNKMADAQTHVLLCTTLPAVAPERYHITALADLCLRVLFHCTPARFAIVSINLYVNYSLRHREGL